MKPPPGVPPTLERLRRRARNRDGAMMVWVGLMLLALYVWRILRPEGLHAWVTDWTGLGSARLEPLGVMVILGVFTAGVLAVKGRTNGAWAVDRLAFFQAMYRPQLARFQQDLGASVLNVSREMLEKSCQPLAFPLSRVLHLQAFESSVEDRSHRLYTFRHGVSRRRLTRWSDCLLWEVSPHALLRDVLRWQVPAPALPLVRPFLIVALLATALLWGVRDELPQDLWWLTAQSMAGGWVFALLTWGTAGWWWPRVVDSWRARRWGGGDPASSAGLQRLQHMLLASRVPLRLMAVAQSGQRASLLLEASSKLLPVPVWRVADAVAANHRVGLLTTVLVQLHETLVPIDGLARPGT